MREPATQLAQFVEDVETFGAGGGATVFATGSTEQHVLRNVLPAYERDGQSHIAEATVVYQDADFCVCRYDTHREQPVWEDEAVQRHVWWVFGTDEFRDDGLVGVKLGNRGNETDVDVWTRERVLDLLKLDSWAPLLSDVASAGDPEVEYRLQGRVGLSWVSP